MKKIFIEAFIFISISAYSYSQEIKYDKINKLEVTGSAELKVPADQAHFSFSVLGYGSSLRQAVENANSKINDISKKLFTMGLKPKDLYTSNFYSGENIDGKAFLSSSKDYKTSVAVSITVDSLPLVQEIILSLSENEVEQISNVDFTLKDYTSLKQKARTQALNNAMLKAKQMAEQAGIKLKRIIYLSEQQPIIYNPVPVRTFNSFQFSTPPNDKIAEQDGTSFYEKTISITDEVFLVYEIE
jgi:uncharacterized protein YggE